jgi:regulator of sigma E protease
MDLVLGALGTSVGSFLSYVVPFLVVLTIIVFFHELGHFLVARWCRVGVEVFSVGFGREVVGWTDRKGTRWKIGWLPLGGYVKFEGDANAASLPSADRREHAKASPGDFHGKPVWQRAMVVAAGPAANFILSVVIFAAAFATAGVPVNEPRVDQVMSGSAAEQAGFQPGDVIVSIDGRKIASFTEVQKIVSDSAGVALSVAVERGGSQVVLQVTPTVAEVPDGLGGTLRIGRLGISRTDTSDFRYERKAPLEALGLALIETRDVSARLLSYIRGIVMGRHSADQLAGPIGIARITKEVAAVSFSGLVQLVAVLSISIGLINLFPIPMLDGGHLLYYAIEVVRGKPLGQEAQEMGFKLGLFLVLALMLVATFNDLSRFNLF